MKSVFKHPEPTHAEQTGPRYWRSLDELQENPAFREYLDREFPEGASELNEVDRRHFMKIMGASFAFGGLALSGCRRPEAKILPYAKTPENMIPGLPLFFASAFPLRKSALPLVVETHSGRPTKIEGNPSYKPCGGSTNLLAQASVLDLYDPDRSTSHRHNGSEANFASVQDMLAGAARQMQSGTGAGFAFLAEQSSSPTRARLVRMLKSKFPKALWAEYEPADQTAPDRVVSRLAGRPAKLHYHFATAKRVLTVDADFVLTEDGHIQFSREFAAGRRVKKSGQEMNRLYSVESALTLTGGMADHRLRLASGQMTAFLARIAREVGVSGIGNVDKLANSVPSSDDWTKACEWATKCAEDLKAFRGESIVMAGSHLPEEAHVLSVLINEALGNRGHTVVILETDEVDAASIKDVVAAIHAGSVQSLFLLGGNPVYNAPADLDWAAAQARVPEVVRLGTHVDESTPTKGWHINAAHYLETWGDARTSDGTIVPIQPMIMPLFGGLSDIEVLAAVLGEANHDGNSLVIETLSKFTTGDAHKAFEKFLFDGLLENSSYDVFAGRLDDSAAAYVMGAAADGVVPTTDKLEVRFVVDPKIDDGRYINNGWLQECPDPITKITWDNAIIVSPRLGAELNILAPTLNLQIIRRSPNEWDLGREVVHWGELTIHGVKIKAPVHVQPGLANYTVILPLGYGRAITGRVGTDSGTNFYPQRHSGGLYIAQGASLSIVEGDRFKLANTQEHSAMEGRAIVREANVETYEKHPDFVKHLGIEGHSPPIYGDYMKDHTLQQRVSETPRGNSLYEHPNLTGQQQWGMSIDLTTCTGCNACVIACQSENNVPIVGRDQVRRGRIMHWIRIDRYYADGRTDPRAFGGPDNAIIPEDPQMVVQPIACQQCETAPCEMVCPVNATVHDEEGINVMAYNRCIGTRYCANNCPYKVRRFNYFDFNKRQLDSLYLGPLGPSGMPELVKMVKNPDVTVRMRGVMEKCTYCIQRIKEAEIHRKVKARDSGDTKVRDGDVRTACQQVCPTEAIVFGDVMDPESAVSKAKAIDRDYELLGYLNTRPRTTFLARLRNPNKNMPPWAYYSLPLTTVEYEAKNGHHEEPGEGHEAAGAGESQEGHH